MEITFSRREKVFFEVRGQAEVVFSGQLSAFFGAGGSILKTSSVFVHTGGEYWFSVCRHFTGHEVTQARHIMHFDRSIVQVLPGLSTLSATVGHFFAQSVQRMHLFVSMLIWPRVLV
jgi:hypothetical protein